MNQTQQDICWSGRRPSVRDRQERKHLQDIALSQAEARRREQDLHWRRIRSINLAQATLIASALIFAALAAAVLLQ